MTEELIENILACKRIFNSEDGKKFLEHLKDIAYYKFPTVNLNESRDLSLWREGKRTLLLDILHYMDCDIEKYKTALRQQKEREKQYE